jgi:hypothetical protein
VVRGSTSGLIGTLVLQNNGGDDLTVTADVNTITVTCTGDPQTVYISMLAYPSQGSNGSGGVTGPAVVSTQEPAYPPILAVKEGVQWMRVLRSGEGNPYALIYTTDHLDGNNHVWSLDLTSRSKLTPTQLSDYTRSQLGLSHRVRAHQSFR